jgi:hypothetical protein
VSSAWPRTMFGRGTRSDDSSRQVRPVDSRPVQSHNRGSLHGSGAAIAPLLILGAAASRFGADKVLLVSPFLLLMLGATLLHLSLRFAAWAPPSYLEEVESFWEEPQQEET